MNEESGTYGFLHGSLHVLVVDHPDGELTRQLAEYPLYAVHSVTSLRRAASLMAVNTHIRACVLSADAHANADEMYLFRLFAKGVPIVASARRCDTSGDLSDGMQRPVSILIEEINRHALGNGLFGAAGENCFSEIAAAREILFLQHPTSVSEWAAAVGVSESELVALFRESGLTDPTRILETYWMYSQAFDYYYDQRTAAEQQPCTEPVPVE